MLICVSLMTQGVEHPFLMIVYLSVFLLWGEVPIESLAHFLTELFVFSFVILNNCPLSDVFCKPFPQPAVLSVHSLDGHLPEVWSECMVGLALI